MYYENGLQEWFEYDASQKRVWSWKASSYWMENGNPEMDSMLLDLPKSGARMLYGREHLIYS